MGAARDIMTPRSSTSFYIFLPRRLSPSAHALPSRKCAFWLFTSARMDVWSSFYCFDAGRINRLLPSSIMSVSHACRLFIGMQDSMIFCWLSIASRYPAMPILILICAAVSVLKCYFVSIDDRALYVGIFHYYLAACSAIISHRQNYHRRTR